MATNDVGLITVSNQWTKLEDLVKSQVANTFAFIEGVPYRIQNIGNTHINNTVKTTYQWGIASTTNSLRTTNANLSIIRV